MKNNKPVNTRKVFWVIAIIAVAAVYQIAHPYIEKQFDVDLPSLMEDENVATIDKPKREWDESDWEIPESGQNEPLIGEAAARKSDTEKGPGRVLRADPVPDDPAKRLGVKSFLTPTGKKNRLRSPAGLVYGQSHGEHRVDHVMRHAKDDPSRPVHSVFEGNPKTILKLIDEAYEQISANSDRVKKTPDQRLDFRAKYTVDMKRKVGYLGGKRGKRENFPPRSKVTLVLDNEKFMVTAYPDR